MPQLTSRSGVGPTYAFIFAVSIVLMLFGWRWAAQVAQESPERGYVIDVAASALPAAAAWWGALALRQRRRGQPPASGAEQAFDVLRWLALVLLALRILLPLL
jgi:hypothetical protein